MGISKGGTVAEKKNIRKAVAGVECGVAMMVYLGCSEI